MPEQKQIETVTVLSYLGGLFTAATRYIALTIEIVFFGGLNTDLESALIVTDGGLDTVIGGLTGGYKINIDDSATFEPLNTANKAIFVATNSDYGQFRDTITLVGDFKVSYFGDFVDLAKVYSSLSGNDRFSLQLNGGFIEAVTRINSIDHTIPTGLSALIGLNTYTIERIGATLFFEFDENSFDLTGVSTSDFKIDTLYQSIGVYFNGEMGFLEISDTTQKHTLDFMSGVGNVFLNSTDRTNDVDFFGATFEKGVDTPISLGTQIALNSYNKYLYFNNSEDSTNGVGVSISNVGDFFEVKRNRSVISNIEAIGVTGNGLYARSSTTQFGRTTLFYNNGIINFPVQGIHGVSGNEWDKLRIEIFSTEIILTTTINDVDYQTIDTGWNNGVDVMAFDSFQSVAGNRFYGEVEYWKTQDIESNIGNNYNGVTVINLPKSIIKEDPNNLNFDLFGVSIVDIKLEKGYNLAGLTEQFINSGEFMDRTINNADELWIYPKGTNLNQFICGDDVMQLEIDGTGKLKYTINGISMIGNTILNIDTWYRVVPQNDGNGNAEIFLGTKTIKPISDGTGTVGVGAVALQEMKYGSGFVGLISQLDSYEQGLNQSQMDKNWLVSISNIN